MAASMLALRGLLAVLLTLSMLPGCRAERAQRSPGVLTVAGPEQVSTWSRNFNPLMPGSRWPTEAGIYEPLAIRNAATGDWVPWLATQWRWEEPGRVLRFELREGVQWSDGAPLTAEDVAFTFELLRRHRALDQRGAWAFLETVEAAGPLAVRFRLARPFGPGLAVLAHQPIVPRHIWAQVADPVTFANPDPVATGPFTQVRRFDPQVYELGRNPRYWQPGRPAVEALRLPALPGNDAANLALVDGELDWAGNYVPAVERVYVRRDPVHHHYWFPPLGGTVFLYPNTTRAPLDDVRVRRALSMAVDRERLVRVAMSGYTRPTTATALPASFASWTNTVAEQRADWLRHDPQKAAQALEEAGLRLGDDGWRTLPDGRRYEPEIAVVSGWSDWVRAAQVIARGLASVGVAARVRLLDQGAWFQRLQEGAFDLAVAWSVEGGSPYDFYRWLMDPATVQPVGAAAAGNWHRHGSAAARPLFDALERTTDEAAERALVGQLQAVFVDELPAVPLFPNPSWGEFNSQRFDGFPSERDPWAVLSPHRSPDCLLVLTALRPAAEAMP